jgi:hypothetical protein
MLAQESFGVTVRAMAYVGSVRDVGAFGRLYREDRLASARRRAIRFGDIFTMLMFWRGIWMFGVVVRGRGASAIDAVWSDCSDCPRALKDGRWML